jgi:transposase
MATRKTPKPKPQPPPPRPGPQPPPQHTPAPISPPVPDHVEPGAPRTAAPVANRHAAGIDVGQTTHWVCVGSTPDGADTVREFPAHTPGLRQLVNWLRQCGVTTVALEASGAYGHVLFLTLLEAGFEVIMTAPHFTRQIKGRPKTDKRDCQWIQRLHTHGMLPSVFQPDDATHTLRAYVRQRANLVRLGAQHVQRMQKALELMNLKLTTVLGDVTGVTGLKIIRAIVAGERDPQVLARMRDRRCQHTAEQIATALDGRYRAEYVTELRLCLKMWDAYQEAIADLDRTIDAHLKTMRRHTALPPLPAQPRVRGRKSLLNPTLPIGSGPAARARAQAPRPQV